MLLLIYFLVFLPIFVQSQYNWNNNNDWGGNYGGGNGNWNNYNGGNGNYGGNNGNYYGDSSPPYYNGNGYNPWYQQQQSGYSPYGQNNNNYYYSQGNNGGAGSPGGGSTQEEESHPAEVYTKQIEKYNSVLSAGKRGPGGVQGMLQGGIEGAVMGGFLGAMGR